MTTFEELRARHVANREAEAEAHPTIAARMRQEIDYMRGVYGAEDETPTSEQRELREQYVASHEASERHWADPVYRAWLEKAVAESRRRNG